MKKNGTTNNGQQNTKQKIKEWTKPILLPLSILCHAQRCTKVHTKKEVSQKNALIYQNCLIFYAFVGHYGIDFAIIMNCQWGFTRIQWNEFHLWFRVLCELFCPLHYNDNVVLAIYLVQFVTFLAQCPVFYASCMAYTGHLVSYLVTIINQW